MTVICFARSYYAALEASPTGSVSTRNVAQI